MLYSAAIALMRAVSFVLYGFRKPDNSKVPVEEGVIVCCNHPGLYDPIFIAAALDRRLTFMAKKELFKFKPFGWIIKSLGAFPVDRYNNDITAIKTTIKLLKSGNALLLFPQGTRNKREDNVKGKHGAIRLAMLSGVKVLPIGITDNYKLFKKAKAVVGEPIDYSEYKGQHLTEDDYDRLTDELMAKIYTLSEGDKE